MVGWIMRVRHSAFARIALWLPLMRASRALCQLPLIAKQMLEEIVAPLGRGRSPGDFQAAGDGVTRDAAGVLARPAQALRFDPGTFRLCAHQAGIARAVGLA